MILVDTSVVVEFLRSGDPNLRRIFVDGDAAICGVTRAEVLHGARDPAHLQRLTAGLNSFQQLSIPEGLWDDIGERLSQLRAAGVTIPLADAIIATVAIHYRVPLWTRDVHYGKIQSVFASLVLFQEPP
jgi:predicted nucleic acid-binding protein